jgi:hypothetical protein
LGNYKCPSVLFFQPVVRIGRAPGTACGWYNRWACVKKKPPDESGDYYVDGLVSSGNQISLHNIKKNFFFQEKN